MGGAVGGGGEGARGARLLLQARVDGAFVFVAAEPVVALAGLGRLGKGW